MLLFDSLAPNFGVSRQMTRRPVCPVYQERFVAESSISRLGSLSERDIIPRSPLDSGAPLHCKVSQGTAARHPKASEMPESVGR